MSAFFCTNSCLGIDSFGNDLRRRARTPVSFARGARLLATLAFALMLAGCADMQHLSPSATLTDTRSLA
ncbi:MAG: hypothetical protein ABI440_11540, partial [Casimicrobiaceae bacterium]